MSPRTPEQRALALRMLQDGATDAAIEVALEALAVEQVERAPVAAEDEKPRRPWGGLVVSALRPRSRVVGGGVTRDREDPFGRRSGDGGGRGRRL